MIPLASDLLPFPDQMRREGHLKSIGLPDRLSSSGRITILDTTLRSCREVIAVPVDKIAGRCKQGVVARSEIALSPTSATSLVPHTRRVCAALQRELPARAAGGTKGSNQTYAVELLRVTG